MKFEECKDKIKGSWVKISDVELSLPSSGYAYVEADVHIPSGVLIMDMEEYTKHVQEEYKEMVLAVLSMGFVDLGVCFGSSHYTCLRKILEDHPDPLGAYQRWKAKKDAAKEMTIKEIEAQLVEKNASKALEDKILTIVKKQICNDGSYFDSQLYKQALDCYKEVLEAHHDEIITAAAKDIADRVMRSKKMRDRIVEETNG